MRPETRLLVVWVLSSAACRPADCPNGFLRDSDGNCVDVTGRAGVDDTDGGAGADPYADTHATDTPDTEAETGPMTILIGIGNNTSATLDAWAWSPESPPGQEGYYYRQHGEDDLGGGEALAFDLTLEDVPYGVTLHHAAAAITASKGWYCFNEDRGASYVSAEEVTLEVIFDPTDYAYDGACDPAPRE